MRNTALIFVVLTIVALVACGSSVDPSVLGVSPSSPLGTEGNLTDYLVSLGYEDGGLAFKAGTDDNMLGIGTIHYFDYKFPKKRQGSVQVIVDGGDVIGIYTAYTGDQYLNKEGNAEDAPGKIFDEVLLDAMGLRVMLKDKITSGITAADTAFEYKDDVFKAQRLEGYWVRNLVALKQYEDNVHMFFKQ